MSAPLVFQDAPDAISYLNHVKVHLASDLETLYGFLAGVSVWAEAQSHGESTVADECLSRIATILRFHPKLLHGFNALLGSGQTLECSTMLEDEEVNFVVLIKENSAQMIPTSGRLAPFPPSDLELRNIIASKESWKDLVESNSDKHWLTCISQMLQILDDPSTDAGCQRRTHRCLRELAKKSILPPSILISKSICAPDFHPRLVQDGPFADIYTGYIRDTRMCFRVLRIFEEPGTNRELLYQDFCSEVLLWRQLKHVNILPFIGVNLDMFPPKFCVVSPWLQNGDIMKYIKKYPDHNKFTSICEVVEGLTYLHNLDPPVVHGAIKGANILVKDDLVCCIADFGLSSIVEAESLGAKSSLWIGSVAWTAPETMDPSRYEIHDSRPSDIYALACTIYEIYTGKPPFLDTHTVVMTIMFSVMKGERPFIPPPGEWTAEEETMWWLVDLCWQDNPRERPEIRLIQHHLKDIGIPPNLRPQPPVFAPEDSVTPSNVSDPGPALLVISKCLQWVLDVDNLQTREIEKFESISTSFSNLENDSRDGNGAYAQQGGTTGTHDSAITAANDLVSKFRLLHDDDHSSMRGETSVSSESIATSFSDSEQSFTSYTKDEPGPRRELTPPEDAMSVAKGLQDPTLHPNWRSKITRQGDRPLDLEYGSLSYLISSRRKLMSGSTISGSSRAAWRNDYYTSASDDLETNASH